MTKRITHILLITLCASLAVTMLLLMLILSQRPIDHNTMRCDFSGLIFGAGGFIILLLTMSAATLYLNLRKSIRNNRWLSLLSCLLLPSFTALTLLIMLGDIPENLKEYAAIFLPYFITLIVQFFSFRKAVQKSSSTVVPGGQLAP